MPTTRRKTAQLGSTDLELEPEDLSEIAAG